MEIPQLSCECLVRTKMKESNMEEHRAVDGAWDGETASGFINPLLF